MDGICIRIEELTKYIQNAERLRILREYIEQMEDGYVDLNDVRRILGMEIKKKRREQV